MDSEDIYTSLEIHNKAWKEIRRTDSCNDLISKLGKILFLKGKHLFKKKIKHSENINFLNVYFPVYNHRLYRVRFYIRES